MSVAENKSEENDIKTPVLDRKNDYPSLFCGKTINFVRVCIINTGKYKVYLGLHIMPYSIIKEVKVRLWSKYDVHFVANNDVNILAGINGSGKNPCCPKQTSWHLSISMARIWSY